MVRREHKCVQQFTRKHVHVLYFEPQSKTQFPEAPCPNPTHMTMVTITTMIMTTPTVTSANERKGPAVLFPIFGFMVVEAVGGVLSGSLALLADAGHMLTDAAALALAYAAFRFGRRAADSKRTFGYLRFGGHRRFPERRDPVRDRRLDRLRGVGRLQAPPVILAGPMMIVAVLGLLVNVLVLWIMTRGETDHVNVKGPSCT